ncbi:hypothetical protein RchiOBHm_Chr3g0464091 [Rosa chinensis]|uniref:Uncharacterized protein n=1 Tax=Rosa chinensis TaxID=74649 RepID=A0A2P6R9D3_ROSCH|nr:hypothetical protein RchiOBHm_Chr3g0464091 [Rosa chinensis]
MISGITLQSILWVWFDPWLCCCKLDVVSELSISFKSCLFLICWLILSKVHPLQRVCELLDVLVVCYFLFLIKHVEGEGGSNSDLGQCKYSYLLSLLVCQKCSCYGCFQILVSAYKFHVRWH